MPAIFNGPPVYDRFFDPVWVVERDIQRNTCTVIERDGSIRVTSRSFIQATDDVIDQCIANALSSVSLMTYANLKAALQICLEERRAAALEGANDATTDESVQLSASGYRVGRIQLTEAGPGYYTCYLTDPAASTSPVSTDPLGQTGGGR